MSDTLLATRRAERDHWLGIELRHLAALATVAERASFSDAADSLGYVQSAVSQQIGSLERIVGRRLVDRSARRRSVTVTDAGRVLLDHIDEILDQLRMAKLEIDALNEQSERGVNFGVDSIFGSWLPAVLFITLLPSTGEVGWNQVAYGPSTTLLDQLKRGELDAAFVPLPISSGPFFGMELARQPYLLAFPRESGCAAVDEVLDRWPLVRIEGCAGTAAMLEQCARGGDTATSLHTATGPASALAVVRSGTAAAVLTPNDVPDDDPLVGTLVLSELPDRIVGLAWHRDRDACATIGALRAAARVAVPRPPAA